MNQPKISIYVPAYNCETTITKCLDSLLAQTYPQVEIVVVNDGSTDKTGEILANYATSCRVITQANQGLGKTRRNAIAVCTGEYVATVDADDYVTPNWLTDCITAMTENNADVGMFGFVSVDQEGHELKYGLKREYQAELLSSVETVQRLGKDELKNMSWGFITKREYWLQVLEHLTASRYYEDVASTYKVMMQANRVALIPGTYYYYVQAEGTITKTPSINQVTDLERIKQQLQADLTGPYQPLLTDWIFHITMMQYQILSLIGGHGTQLKQLKQDILANIPAGMSKAERIKVLLVRMNLYSHFYGSIKKLRNI